MASGSQNMTTFKAKGLTSIANIVDTSNFIFLKSTTLTADQLGDTVSLSLNAVGVTGAAMTNHSLFLNAGVGSGLGAPFQLQIPDSSHLYIYKRWYSSNVWSGWSKISAGHADDAAKWTTARTITLTGSVTGSVSIDGSGNVSLATTTNHNHDWRYPQNHITSFAFTGNNRPLSRYVTFDLNAPAGGPGGWINGFMSVHNDYLASYIVQVHRSDDWYLGWNQYSTTNSTVDTAPVWRKIIHSGNIGSQSVKNATTWAGLTSRWNHNTSDTWIPVRSNNNIDYVLKTEIANSATAFVKKSGDTMTSTLTLSGGSINVQQGSVWAGTNGNTSGERQVGCQSGAGILYMYSQAATNGSRGIYGANHAGTYTSYLYIQQDNYVRAGTRLYGAVWNDYAEFRLGQMNGLKPGQIVTENGDGTMCLASKRLQKGCKVLSDTYGFALGETNEYKLPIAVSGRVLVYCDTPIEELEPGDCLCSNVTGNAVKMTREEIINYPDCIIGTVSEIPTYNIWHCGDQTNENGMKEEVWVNGRIWIYVR